MTIPAFSETGAALKGRKGPIAGIALGAMDIA